jgi:hypothetical protein
MAAGLGFKTFTTGEVLTAADVNGYLMQGVLVFASEAARNSAITAPQEGQFAFTKDTNSLWYYSGSAWVASGATGDIEGVTAGTGISGGGTSGTVTITNSMATEITAKADLIVGTGNAAFDNLAVGANGTVLTADSTVSPTGLKWAAPAAGSLTLIASGSLSGSTFTISSIPQTYSDIRLYLFNWSANNNGDLVWKINNTTANTYYYIASSNAAINNTGTSGSGIRLSSSITQAAYTSNMGCLEILNYTSTTAFKPIRGFSLNQQNGPYLESYYGGGAFADNTAVTSIVLDPESTNTFDNGTYALYGIN